MEEMHVLLKTAARLIREVHRSMHRGGFEALKKHFRWTVKRLSM